MARHLANGFVNLFVVDRKKHFFSSALFSQKAPNPENFLITIF